MKTVLASNFSDPANCPLCKSIAKQGWYVAPTDGTLRIPYHMPPGGKEHRDQDRGPTVNVLSSNLQHFRIVWEQQVDRPTTEGEFNGKLLYLNDAPKNRNWDLIFAVGGMTKDGIGRMSLSTNARDCSDLVVPVFMPPIVFGRRYLFVLDVRLNTPGNRDGRIEFTIDGIVPPMWQGKNDTPRDLRNGCSLRSDASPLKTARWGMQVDRNTKGTTWNGEVIEDRWLRDVVVETP